MSALKQVLALVERLNLSDRLAAGVRRAYERMCDDCLHGRHLQNCGCICQRLNHTGQSLTDFRHSR